MRCESSLVLAVRAGEDGISVKSCLDISVGPQRTPVEWSEMVDLPPLTMQCDDLTLWSPVLSIVSPPGNVL